MWSSISDWAEKDGKMFFGSRRLLRSPQVVRSSVAMRLGIAWGGLVQDAIAKLQNTFKEFPPGQKGGTLRPGGN